MQFFYYEIKMNKGGYVFIRTKRKFILKKERNHEENNEVIMFHF